MAALHIRTSAPQLSLLHAGTESSLTNSPAGGISAAVTAVGNEGYFFDCERKRKERKLCVTAPEFDYTQLYNIISIRIRMQLFRQVCLDVSSFNAARMKESVLSSSPQHFLLLCKFF